MMKILKEIDGKESQLVTLAIVGNEFLEEKTVLLKQHNDYLPSARQRWCTLMKLKLFEAFVGDDDPEDQACLICSL